MTTTPSCTILRSKRPVSWKPSPGVIPTSTVGPTYPTGRTPPGPVCETSEPEIMMRVHQQVEARPFGRRDPTDRDIRQREAFWRFPENGIGVRIRRYPAPCRTQPIPEGQRKIPSCGFFLRDVFQTKRRQVVANVVISRPNPVRTHARATDRHVLSIKKWQKTV